MKKVILFGTAAAVLAATPAIAQNVRGGGASQTRADVPARVQAAFARVDTNRDGFVTQAEAQSAPTVTREQRQANRGERRANRGGNREARFAALDTNGNGSISRDEFFARRGGQGADRAERQAARAERRAQRGGQGLRFGGRGFERMDSNQDGRVSLAEATASRLQRFDRIDTNRDGRLTREERQAARAQRRATRG